MRIGNDFSIDLVSPVLKPETTDRRMAQTEKAGSLFEDFYKAALDMFNETNVHQVTADKAQIDFATGRSDDMIALVMAQRRAETSLSFTVQMTTRIIDAYKEIMRMQV